MGDFDDLLPGPEDEAAEADRRSSSSPADLEDSGDPTTHPPLVGAGASEVETALREGTIVALPAVGGYCLAVQAGAPGVEERLVTLAADPDGPHYAVGHRDQVRALVKSGAWAPPTKSR